MTAAKAALTSAIDGLVTLATNAVNGLEQTNGTGSGTGGSGTDGSGTGGSGTGGSGSSGSGTGGSGGTGSNGEGHSSGSTSSAGSDAAQNVGGRGQGGSSQTVAQAEAAMAGAQLDLTNARLALDGATLVAPASGVLTALPWTVGGTASTSDVATVSSPGGRQLTIDVAEAAIGTVKVGQDAVVTSATGTQSQATVGRIGVLPSSTSGSAVTYPVTLVVRQPGDGLAEGTTASVLLTVASAQDAVLVPVSAVTLTSTTEGTVTTLGADGQVSATRVGIGVSGATQVEITDGLAAGTTVVLADISAAIPTSTSGFGANRGGSSLTGGGGVRVTGGGGFGGGAPPR